METEERKIAEWYLKGIAHAYRRSAIVAGIIVALLGISTAWSWHDSSHAVRASEQAAQSAHRLSEALIHERHEREGWRQTADDWQRAAEHWQHSSEVWQQRAGRESTRTAPASAEDTATVLNLVNRAQVLVRAARTLPGAWRWNETRLAVEEMGGRIPIEVLQGGSEGHALREGASITLQLSDRLRTFSIEDVSHVLVHEAAHVVFYRMFGTVLDGPIAEDQPGYQPLCADDRLDFLAATEALSYLNEWHWVQAERHQQTSEASETMRDLGRNIQGCEQHDGRTCIRYATFAYTYALTVDFAGRPSSGDCRHAMVRASTAYPEFFVDFVAHLTP